MIARILRSPYGVMAVVLVMYAAKVTAKLGIGSRVNSPMITGDGWHNVADIFEALLVIVAVVMARRPENGEYPFGRKNAESLLSAAIGAGLCFMALKLAAGSVLGLAAWLPGMEARVAAIDPFERETLLMGARYLPWVLGVTAGSALLSLAVSRYEIAVGKKTGHDSMVADGKETLSDAMIEFATVAGVCAEYLFDQPRLEHVFTLVVAFKMAQTGREILDRGLDALLQRSIGREHEDAVRTAAMTTHGVADVAEIKTFRVGPKAVVIMKLITRADAAAHRLIKRAMVARIVSYLREKEFTDGAFFIRFDPPDLSPHRVGYAVVREGSTAKIAASFARATHLRLCDVEDGEAVRWKDVPLPSDPGGKVDILVERRVRELFTHGDGSPVAPLPAAIRQTALPKDDPAAYGL